MNQGNIISIVFGSIGILTFALSYFQTSKRDARNINKEEFFNSSNIITNIEFIKNQLEDLSTKISSIENEIKNNTINTTEILTSLKEQIKTLFTRVATIEDQIAKLDERIRRIENGK